MPRKSDKDMKNSETSDSDSEWTPSCENESKKNVKKDTKKDVKNEAKKEAKKEGDAKKEMSTLEMQKFMNKIFPSKSGAERIKMLEEMEKINKTLEKKDKNIKKQAINKLKINSTSISAKKKSKKKCHEEEESKFDNDEEDEEEDYDDDDYDERNYEEEGGEEEDEEEEDYDDEDEEYDDENEDLKNILKNNMKFNIVFTVDEKGALKYKEEDEDYDEDEEDDEDDEDEEDGEVQEEEQDNTIEKQNVEIKKGTTNKKKNIFTVGDKVFVKDREWDEEYIGNITKINSRNRYDVKLADKELDKRSWKMINGKYIRPYTDEDREQEEVISELKELIALKKEKGSKAMLSKFDKYVKQEEKRIKAKEDAKKAKMIEKNVKSFKQLILNKKKMSDIKYFKGLDKSSQDNIIKELKEVNKHTYIEKPYTMALLESSIDPVFKSEALKKINVLNFMDPGSSEYYKVKLWVDAFMKIPFGTNISLPVSMNDERHKYCEFMEDSKRILDETVHGLEDAKMQMMQFLGQLIVNPESVGCTMALVGPPGTGKTTLIKEAFSKIIKRPFAMCALGGAEDGSHWKGHDYTYMESKYGRIVEILIQSKCMNPLIYFDELCKVSDSPKGEEVIGMLTHLTDTTQNDKFEDKFFSGLEFNLSQAMFVFSYNDERRVNPVLKNRFYRITTKGYDKKDQVIIAKKHLIPKIQKNIKFEEDEIDIPDKTLEYIIEHYTESEKGVRNLKRCLEIIYTKINLYKLMPADSTLFDGCDVLKITKPFIVTEDVVKKLIKKEETNKIPFGFFT